MGVCGERGWVAEAGGWAGAKRAGVVGGTERVAAEGEETARGVAERATAVAAASAAVSAWRPPDLQSGF